MMNEFCNECQKDERLIFFLLSLECALCSVVLLSYSLHSILRAEPKSSSLTQSSLTQSSLTVPPDRCTCQVCVFGYTNSISIVLQVI
jgi:hypothetical protein